MAPGTDDPKDLGSKKINNQEKESDKNEGFSGENLPKNYDPSTNKLKTEIEKDEEGNTETVKRARDTDEKQAPPVSEGSNTTRDDGEVVSKNRGTKNDSEDNETRENRDLNSDIDKDRYNESDEENRTSRGNINFGK